MGEFHLDGYIVFFLLACLITMVFRTLVNKLKKWVRHTIWMKRKAHGTLVTDPEASFWLKKIEDTRYKPVWRWYYAEEWKRSRGAIGPKKSLTRHWKKIARVNAALAVLVGIIVVLTIMPGWTGVQFPTQTEVTFGSPIAATLDYISPTLASYTALNEYVTLPVTIERTDSAFANRIVTFSVQTFDNGNSSAPWLIFMFFQIDDLAQTNITIFNDGSNWVNLTFSLRESQTVRFFADFFFRPLPAVVDEKQLLAEITVTGTVFRATISSPGYTPLPRPGA